jgi:hypothetical protein
MLPPDDEIFTGGFMISSHPSSKKSVKKKAAAKKSVNSETRLTRKIAEEFLADEDSVDLNKFTVLASTAAEVLNKHRGDLFLDGLTTLSDSVAKWLSNHTGELYLDGLTTLSDKAATYLCAHKGYLSTEGLHQNSSASEIIRFHFTESMAVDFNECLDVGEVYLIDFDDDEFEINGLSIEEAPPATHDLEEFRTLDDEAARIIARSGAPWLNLASLHNLSEAAAQSLATFPGPLFLDSLEMLTARTAKALVIHQRGLSLARFNHLPQTTAKLLSQYPGELSLPGLTSLSRESAAALSKHPGVLYLNGLRKLPAPTAQNLARHRGGLVLRGLKHLSGEAARAFVDSDADLTLGKLTALTRKAAKALAKHKGELSLELGTLPKSTADLIRQHPTFQRLPLVHLNETDPDWGTHYLLITRRQDDGRFQVEQWVNGAIIEIESDIETAEHYHAAMSRVADGCHDYFPGDFHDQIKQFDKSLGMLLEQWEEN